HGGGGLWNDEDGFYYDTLNLPDGTHYPLRIRSMVGLIPLFAVETLEPEWLKRVLQVLLDEKEFLSPYGIRSLSKYHEQHPYTLTVGGQMHRVDYEPAESTSGLFGGNSNWS